VFSALRQRAKLGAMPTGRRARDEKHAALARLEVFSALSESERDAVAEVARLRRYGKGRALVTQGSVTEATFGIVTGRLRVSLSRADGSEAALAILGPGQIFGELGLFQDGSRSARVTALEDVSVLSIGKSELLYILERSPAASLALCRLLASRVRQLARHFDEVTAMPVEQRLARKLVFLAQRWGQSSGAGTYISLQSANKCFTKWRKLGILASTTSRLVIQDRRRLEGCANGIGPIRGAM
jgi:CRP/FNR family cyclic AMP-dependent transcriptional regulator